MLPFGIRANMTLASLGAHARNGFISYAKELATTRKFGARLSVKAANWEQALSQLSGGNQQKVVIGKWLATNPRILILDEPTKGIDIGSKAAVHEFMGELASEGLAILLVSSELPEVMGMADTILVMHEGHIVRRFARGEATRRNDRQRRHRRRECGGLAMKAANLLRHRDSALALIVWG